jgi:hypothetical protein
MCLLQSPLYEMGSSSLSIFLFWSVSLFAVAPFHESSPELALGPKWPTSGTKKFSGPGRAYELTVFLPICCLTMRMATCSSMTRCR